ncbi:unnamed protein product [Oppiella nova]|uniref:Uncharacterized protein n=1 Tax=Oppiella nova TaxID=334625 RepID=A0A7R9QS28_9ACAR|nr:unnamed protein product [Oppiella nova]CAG2172252.1 unnamed protein product [Oppiella nova]
MTHKELHIRIGISIGNRETKSFVCTQVTRRSSDGIGVVVLMSLEVVDSREHRLFVSSGSCGGLIVMYSSEAPVDDSPTRGLSGQTVRPLPVHHHWALSQCLPFIRLPPHITYGDDFSHLVVNADNTGRTAGPQPNSQLITPFLSLNDTNNGMH